MLALSPIHVRLRSAIGLDAILAHEMRNLHSAECQRFTVLPSMAAAATMPALRAWLEIQCKQTVMHLQRLESATELLGTGAEGRNNQTMRSLVEEAYGRCMLPSGLRDAGLLCTAGKMAHYEIANWTNCCQYARWLRQPRLFELFHGAVTDASIAGGQLDDLRRTLPPRLAVLPAPRPQSVRGNQILAV